LEHNVFHLTKEDLERDRSAAVWNMLKFQTTPERQFSAAIAPFSLRLEHVMFQTQMSGPAPPVPKSYARRAPGASGWKSRVDERMPGGRRGGPPGNELA
jgi:hypothetical protein